MAKKKAKSKLLTVREVAERLDVATSTVRIWRIDAEPGKGELVLAVQVQIYGIACEVAELMGARGRSP